MPSQIKTFNFIICNTCSHDGRKEGKHIVNMSEIDAEINKFLRETNAVIEDIKVSTYTSCQHNNAGSNEVYALYTVIYHNIP